MRKIAMVTSLAFLALVHRSPLQQSHGRSPAQLALQPPTLRWPCSERSTFRHDYFALCRGPVRQRLSFFARQTVPVRASSRLVTRLIKSNLSTLHKYSSSRLVKSNLTTLYKVSADGDDGEECLESDMMNYEPLAVWTAGFKKGTCASKGFTVASGTKIITKPLIGKMTTRFYRKVSWVKERVVAMYKIVGSKCAQANVYEPWSFFFSGFTEGTCSSEGFTDYAGLESIAEPFLDPVLGKIAVAYFKRPVPAKERLRNTIAVSKIVGETCLQYDIRKKFEPFDLLFSGFAVGTCASHGFTEEVSVEVRTKKILGVYTARTFGKPGWTEAQKAKVTEGAVDMYKITNDKCVQAHVYKPSSFFFSGFKEGTCVSQGFIDDDSTIEIKEPLLNNALGAITVKVFKGSASTMAAHVDEATVAGEEDDLTKEDPKREPLIITFPIPSFLEGKDEDGKAVLEKQAQVEANAQKPKAEETTAAIKAAENEVASATPKREPLIITVPIPSFLQRKEDDAEASEKEDDEAASAKLAEAEKQTQNREFDEATAENKVEESAGMDIEAPKRDPFIITFPIPSFGKREAGETTADVESEESGAVARQAEVESDTKTREPLIITFPVPSFGKREADETAADEESEESRVVARETEVENETPTREPFVINFPIPSFGKRETDETTAGEEGEESGAVAREAEVESDTKTREPLIITFPVPSFGKREADETTADKNAKEAATKAAAAAAKKEQRKVEFARKEKEKRKVLLEKQTVSFVFGASNIPHPDKIWTGGEDAFFVDRTRRAFGVADGVSSWRREGVDAGKYSRELMRKVQNAIPQRHDQGKAPESLKDVLTQAYDTTRSAGSCTVCFAQLDPEASTMRVLNLGDSGLWVLRKRNVDQGDWQLVWEAPQQLHSINTPYQLSSDRTRSNRPTDAALKTVKLKVGDLLVAASDGLWDNMRQEELLDIVQRFSDVRGGKGLKPEELSKKIAQEAWLHSRDPKYLAPKGYTGGKPDDITVVTALVVSSNAPGTNWLSI